MRRVWAGIGQAVESAAIAVVGLLLCAFTMLVVWGVDQGFGGDPLVQWRIAADAWLLGHGVDLGVTLGREGVLLVGLEDAAHPFVVSLGAWGIGLITVWLHWRCGRRLATMPFADAAIAMVLGAMAMSAVGALIASSAQHGAAAPNLAHAAIFPALVAVAGMLGAVVATRGHDWLRATAKALTLDDEWVRPLRAAMRAGFAATAAVLGVGALLVGAGLFLRFGDGLLLMESLNLSVVGVLVLFLVQLVLAPVAIVWAASWAIGPGFVLGAGSSVTPMGTQLGPVPALPLLTAIDPDVPSWMAVVVVLPVLAAVLVGVLARQSVLSGTRESPVHWWELALAALGGGVLAGVLLGLLAMLSTGAAGPGRLAEAGPDAVVVAAWAALEVGAGLLVGMLAGGHVRGVLGGGFAVPLAAQREGTSMRDVFGLGRFGGATDAESGEAESGDAADEPSDPSGAGDEPSDASDAGETRHETPSETSDETDTDSPAELARAAEPEHPRPVSPDEQPTDVSEPLNAADASEAGRSDR